MNLDLATVIIWAFGIALALIILRILWTWLRLAVLLSAFGVTVLFILDKAAGGTALEQVANKIADWIRTKVNL